MSTLAEGHPKGHLFAQLKGYRSWVAEYLDPPLPAHLHSARAGDIVDSLQPAVRNVSAWLIRAGADVNARDCLSYR